MDPPAAVANGVGIGSFLPPKLLSPWGEAAGVGGSIGDGQEQNGRVASSQCKIAAAHSAQMGELPLSADWARNSPAQEGNDDEPQNFELRSFHWVCWPSPPCFSRTTSSPRETATLLGK